MNRVELQKIDRTVERFSIEPPLQIAQLLLKFSYPCLCSCEFGSSDYGWLIISFIRHRRSRWRRLHLERQSRLRYDAHLLLRPQP